MIFDFIINGFFDFIDSILELLPSMPNIVDFSDGVFNTFKFTVLEYGGLVDIIFPLNLLKVILAALIVLIFAKFGWSLLMFIIKKIPFFSIR